jgi:hypothetical protein
LGRARFGRRLGVTSLWLPAAQSFFCHIVFCRTFEIVAEFLGNGPMFLERLFNGLNCSLLLFLIAAGLQDWQRFDKTLARAVSGIPKRGRYPSAVTFGTPLSNLPKHICIGANYRDHLEEMKVTTLPDLLAPFYGPTPRSRPMAIQAAVGLSRLN